jgi:cation:H+ antiporter
MLPPVTALLPAFAVLIGLGMLVVGADRFVAGARDLALRLGMSPMLVGMLVVGVGTSTPEMLVSLMAALEGDGGIAVGNAIGSNASNIGLVLAVTALVAPVPLDREMVRKEFPLLAVVTGGYYLIFLDGELGQEDGALLLVGLVLLVSRMVMRGRDEKSAGHGPDAEPTLSMGQSILWQVGGLAVMVGGSRAIVWGAVEIARGLGIDELVIGLTIVAIGTSLPELAASVAAALRREHELAVGNILGSNMFNLVLVLPFPALLSPGAVDAAVWQRDYPVMLGLTCVLVGLGVLGAKTQRMGRRAGSLLLTLFVAYLAWLVWGALNPGLAG